MGDLTKVLAAATEMYLQEIKADIAAKSQITRQDRPVAERVDLDPLHFSDVSALARTYDTLRQLCELDDPIVMQRLNVVSGPAARNMRDAVVAISTIARHTVRAVYTNPYVVERSNRSVPEDGDLS